MRFQALDEIEVIATEQGLQGSVHPAIILHRLPHRMYLIQYKRLVSEKNKRMLLEERVPEHLIRPAPLPIFRRRFRIGDEVDALHRDAWWYGRVVKTYGTYYGVKFDGYRRVWYYPFGKLRLHQA